MNNSNYEEDYEDEEDEVEEYPHRYAKLYDGSKRKRAKRIIKFLAEWNNDPKMTAHILRHAPKPVIKGLANLAFNLKHNPDIYLSPRQKRFCRRNRATIDVLADPDTSVEEKRSVLTSQRGGAFPFLLALPPLIAAGLKYLGAPILGAVASGIASRLASRREEE